MRRKGFTLIEMLVVIAIISLLVGLLLPAVQQARDAARRTQCKNNMRQQGLSLFNYHDAFRLFPPGYLYRPGQSKENAAGFGWGAMILPFLDQTALYRQFNWDVAIWDVANANQRTASLATFKCPSDSVSSNGFLEMGPAPEKYAMASYVACFGPPDLDAAPEQRDGMFSRNSRTQASEVTDGLSNTLMVGERMNGPFRTAVSRSPHNSYQTTWAGAVRQWDDPSDDHGHMVLFQTGHAPNSPLSDERDVSARHIGFAQFLLADGSVRIIGENIDFGVYQNLSTRAGGEIIAEY